MQTQSVAQLLQKKFIGTDDLRRELTSILDKLPQEGGQIVVTQHGKPQAILLDLESYLNLHETLEDLQTPGLVESIYKGVAEIDHGQGLSLDQLKKNLKL